MISAQHSVLFEFCRSCRLNKWHSRMNLVQWCSTLLSAIINSFFRQLQTGHFGWNQKHDKGRIFKTLFSFKMSFYHVHYNI
jgi:hypothetical protein